MPVLPLRDVVVYPHMVIPLFVGRERSIVALNKAMDAGKRILLVAQKQADHDDPQPSDTRSPEVEGGRRAEAAGLGYRDHDEFPSA